MKSRVSRPGSQANVFIIIPLPNRGPKDVWANALYFLFGFSGLRRGQGHAPLKLLWGNEFGAKNWCAKKNAQSLNDFEFVRKKFLRKKTAHREIAHSENDFVFVRKKIAHRKIAHKLVNQTSIPPARLFRDSLKIYEKKISRMLICLPLGKPYW